MHEPQSTSNRIACYFPRLAHDEHYHMLRDHVGSIYIIGSTNDECYTEIAVDSACIASLAKVLTFGINLPYFILPPWHTMGLEEAVSQWLSEATGRIRNGGGRQLMKYYCFRARQTCSFLGCPESIIPTAPLKWAALSHEVEVQASYSTSNVLDTDSSQKASYTVQMTYVQILAFCGLLIDPDSPSLGNISKTTLLHTLRSNTNTRGSNDDRQELHVIALFRCLFELAGGDVDEDEIYDLDKSVSFADNIRLCAEFVGVHCSRNWTLRLAKNIELCESVIDIYLTPAASKPEAHPSLYLLEIAADFASNRSSFLQPNHVNVFDGIQELGMLLPNNTLVQSVGPLKIQLMLNISLLPGVEEVRDTWFFLIWRAIRHFDRAEIRTWAESEDGGNVLSGLLEAEKSHRPAIESTGISLAIASFYQLLPLARPESSELEGPEYDPWLFIISFFAASALTWAHNPTHIGRNFGAILRDRASVLPVFGPDDIPLPRINAFR
ncbi:hypothetical protein LZ32DRAFT_623675 [Colletotrichum eremochloae]|nr:hypothetical protein LZ32DRAFT_623675 [Colletotrichum eremochloae]